jgi:hypothetical protein
MKRWFPEKINDIEVPFTKVTIERGRRFKLIQLEMKGRK